jgi:hypothetical protein
MKARFDQHDILIMQKTHLVSGLTGKTGLVWSRHRRLCLDRRRWLAMPAAANI